MGLTIEDRTYAEDFCEPASRLEDLVQAGKLREFMGCMEESTDVWMALCALEDDLIKLEEKNPASKATEGWFFEVGRSEVLPELPKWLEWGEVSAWILYGDYILELDTPGRRVIVWESGDFYEEKVLSSRGTFQFADDSAIHMNRILKAFERQDG